MAKVTIDLPDELEQRIKLEADRAGKTLSAYLSDLARARLVVRQHAEALAGLYGSCEGQLEAPADLPDDDVHGR